MIKKFLITLSVLLFFSNIIHANSFGYGMVFTGGKTYHGDEIPNTNERGFILTIEHVFSERTCLVDFIRYQLTEWDFVHFLSIFSDSGNFRSTAPSSADLCVGWRFPVFEGALRFGTGISSVERAAGTDLSLGLPVFLEMTYLILKPFSLSGQLYGNFNEGGNFYGALLGFRLGE